MGHKKPLSTCPGVYNEMVKNIILTGGREDNRGEKNKQAVAELWQAQVQLEVIVKAECYLELKMKLATTNLCDWMN